MEIDQEVAFGTAVLGYDLIQGDEVRVQNYNRMLVATGLVGSAAIGDTVVEVRVGGRTVQKVRNDALGLAMLQTTLNPTRFMVPANVQVQAIVTDAPATNNIRIKMIFVP